MTRSQKTVKTQKHTEADELEDLVDTEVAEIDEDLDVEDEDIADEDVEVGDDFTFSTTPYTEEQLAERKTREFRLDGNLLIAEQPDDAAYALLSQAVASAATNADRTHAILNFAWGCLDDRSKMIVQSRLYDRSDSFGLETLAQIVDKLLVDFSPDPDSGVNRAARRNAAKARQRSRSRR